MTSPPDHDPESLQQRLASDATVRARLDVFAALGLRRTEVARAVGVSTEAVHVWARGKPVRPANHEALENLAATALTLLEAETGPGATRWLSTSQAPGADAPIDLIRESPRTSSRPRRLTSTASRKPLRTSCSQRPLQDTP